MRKKLFGIIWIILAITSSAFAQADDPAIEEISVSSITRSAYLYHGAIYYDKPVQQSELVVAWRNGLFASVWTSIGYNTTVGTDEEADFILGYSKSVGKFNFSTDAAYFAVPGI